MRIQVKTNFGGKETRERRILPGVYDESDPALFGLAEYLLKNGHAVPVDDASYSFPIAAIEWDVATGDVRNIEPGETVRAGVSAGVTIEPIVPVDEDDAGDLDEFALLEEDFQDPGDTSAAADLIALAETDLDDESEDDVESEDEDLPDWMTDESDLEDESDDEPADPPKGKNKRK